MKWFRGDNGKFKKETDRVELKVNGKKFDNTKMREGEILIERGDSNKFDVVIGSVKEATNAGMKIRIGHNKDEEKFFIQLTDRESLRSFRVYLTVTEFTNLINYANGIKNMTMRDTGI